jgi:hypothetical protein
MAQPGPLSLRISDDVRAGAHQAAEAAGLSLSEWCREVIYRAVYGEPMGADQGYVLGRAIAYKVAMRMFGQVEMPGSVEDGVRFLQSLEGSPGRTPHSS